MVAVAAGVARFLSVESCGQCTPCKQDGLTIADLLAVVCANDATPQDLELIDKRLGTVVDGARCFLATQQQVTVTSILEAFPEELDAHLAKRSPVTEPALITELTGVSASGGFWDERFATKQPDWSHDEAWSGQTPADRYRDHLVDQLDD
jgi:hypothetical protein